MKMDGLGIFVQLVQNVLHIGNAKNKFAFDKLKVSVEDNTQNIKQKPFNLHFTNVLSWTILQPFLFTMLQTKTGLWSKGIYTFC